MDLTRRAFLKYTAGTALTLYVLGPAGERVALAQVPGSTLDPLAVPQFAQPLLVPPAMPRAGRGVRVLPEHGDTVVALQYPGGATRLRPGSCEEP